MRFYKIIKFDIWATSSNLDNREYPGYHSPLPEAVDVFVSQG